MCDTAFYAVMGYKNPNILISISYSGKAMAYIAVDNRDIATNIF